MILGLPGDTKQLLTAFPQLLRSVPSAPLGRAWEHVSVPSRSGGNCKSSPGHCKSSLLFSSSFLGLGDSWVVCHSLTALGLLLVFPGLPGWWLVGHDLFIEGRGQLGQPASCGQGVWFVNSPENWRTSQVGKVSHMGPLQVVEYGWSA